MGGLHPIFAPVLNLPACIAQFSFLCLFCSPCIPSSVACCKTLLSSAGALCLLCALPALPVPQHAPLTQHAMPWISARICACISTCIFLGPAAAAQPASQQASPTWGTLVGRARHVTVSTWAFAHRTEAWTLTKQAHVQHGCGGTSTLVGCRACSTGQRPVRTLHRLPPLQPGARAGGWCGLTRRPGSGACRCRPR